MKFLRVRNLPRYQHYRHRNPPWVKLHQELLENFEFAMLADATKAHALLIILLASRTDNRLPADPAWIRGKICAQSRVDIGALVAAGFLEDAPEDASSVLADCTQGAIAERETEGETETEKTGGRASAVDAFDLPFVSERFREAFASWLRHRFEKRKPLQPDSEAWRQQRKKFDEWGEEGSIESIETAVANGWQGVFPPKNGRNGARQSQPVTHARGKFHAPGTLKAVNVLRATPPKEPAA